MSHQLSTQEQQSRYQARSPEEQELRRVARRARRAIKKLAHTSKPPNKTKQSLDLTIACNINDVICIDLEQYERNQNKLTEVGISVNNPTTNTVDTIHLIISANYNKRNKKYVVDNKDNFVFGTSIFVSLADAKQIISQYVNKSKYIVGHGIKGDVKFIKGSLGIEVAHTIKMIDTQLVDQVVCSRKSPTKLSNVCNEYGVNHTNPHNAGNDSHVNLTVFNLMKQQLNNRG